MKLIDTHCHLTSSSFSDDLEEVIHRARENGIEKIISIGCSLEDAKKTIEISENYEEIFAAISLHPADLHENWEGEFDILATFATHEKVVAIGETGLDFFRAENAPRTWQEKSFRAHFELARKVQKPLVIHSRAASEETLEILREFEGHPFVWHCFSESMEVAEEAIHLGGMISFTGILTFPKSTQIQEVARNLPLEKIMIETDAPFLAPIPHRGKRCEPAFVKDTATFLADLRGMSLDEFVEVTTANARKFFTL